MLIAITDKIFKISIVFVAYVLFKIVKNTDIIVFIYLGGGTECWINGKRNQWKRGYDDVK